MRDVPSSVVVKEMNRDLESLCKRRLITFGYFGIHTHIYVLYRCPLHAIKGILRIHTLRSRGADLGRTGP
jgi:predicted RND superfamily exporter protein